MELWACKLLLWFVRLGSSIFIAVCLYNLNKVRTSEPENMDENKTE